MTESRFGPWVNKKRSAGHHALNCVRYSGHRSTHRTGWRSGGFERPRASPPFPNELVRAAGLRRSRLAGLLVSHCMARYCAVYDRYIRPNYLDPGRFITAAAAGVGEKAPGPHRAIGRAP